jgi:hypothetical protein
VQKWFGLLAALAAGFVIFYFGSVTPPPAPADAPPTSFSAGRAMADIRAMGSVAHPVGSPANAEVRDYLIRRMTGLGLNPVVERGSSFEIRGADIAGGTVDNVIGVLPGRDRSAPALVLMAHHDSVPGSPGAADDTAGVASALEIVRAIKTKGVPERDVMLVITDGEEAGLLGARAFFDQSPLAAHVGYIINMETRGGGGRTVMFETAADDGGDIALYHRTAWMPESNALTVFIYQHLPNDTDFTVAKQHGKVGLNYAFIGRQFDYHSPSSTPAALDVGSLQHMGAQILPTAIALAFGPLPARAPDVVYGNVLGGLMAVYPVWFGWVLLIAAAGLIAFGATRAMTLKAYGWVDVARGVGASLYTVATAGVLLDLARKATGVGAGWIPYRAILARFATFEVMMLVVAVGAISATAIFAGRGGRSRWIAAGLAMIAGAACSLFGGFDSAALVLGGCGFVIGVVTFGRPARLPGSWTGLLIVALLSALVVQVLAPTAAYILTWPLLTACLAAALTAAGADQGRWRRSLAMGVELIAATLLFAWLGALFHSLLQGLDLPLLGVFPAWMAALMVWPLVFPDRPEDSRLLPAGAFVVVGLILAAWLHLTSPWTPRHPNSVEPVYVLNPAAHKAWRASLLKPDIWTRDVLTAEGGALVKLPLAFKALPVDAAAARPAAVEPAPVTMSAAADGQVSITAHLHPGAARLIVTFTSATAIDGVSINGKPALYTPRGGRPSLYVLKAGAQGRIIWSGPDGFTLSFHTADPNSVKVRTAEVYDHWLGGKPLPKLPPTDQAWDMAGSSFVIGSGTNKP